MAIEGQTSRWPRLNKAGRIPLINELLRKKTASKVLGAADELG